MNAYLVGGLLTFLVGVATAVIAGLLSEEIRNRLDTIPYALLRLAARRLDPAERVTVYEAEWLPELEYILRGAEAQPITRLANGTHYAVGILLNARRIIRHLHRDPSHSDDRRSPAEPVQLPGIRLAPLAAIPLSPQPVQRQVVNMQMEIPLDNLNAVAAVVTAFVLSEKREQAEELADRVIADIRGRPYSPNDPATHDGHLHLLATMNGLKLYDQADLLSGWMGYPISHRRLPSNPRKGGSGS